LGAKKAKKKHGEVWELLVVRARFLGLGEKKKKEKKKKKKEKKKKKR